MVSLFSYFACMLTCPRPRHVQDRMVLVKLYFGQSGQGYRYFGSETGKYRYIGPCSDSSWHIKCQEMITEPFLRLPSVPPFAGDTLHATLKGRTAEPHWLHSKSFPKSTPVRKTFSGLVLQYRRDRHIERAHAT